MILLHLGALFEVRLELGTRAKVLRAIVDRDDAREIAGGTVTERHRAVRTGLVARTFALLIDVLVVGP